MGEEQKKEIGKRRIGRNWDEGDRLGGGRWERRRRIDQKRRVRTGDEEEKNRRRLGGKERKKIEEGKGEYSIRYNSNIQYNTYNVNTSSKARTPTRNIIPEIETNTLLFSKSPLFR